MAFILKEFQADIVRQVGKDIQDSEVVETLRKLRGGSLNRSLWERSQERHEVLIQAPTGAGKTVILGSIIRDYLQDFVTLVFSPGAGGLEKQTADKLGIITGSTSVITESSLNVSPVEGHSYVCSWEALVAKDDRGDYLRRLTRDSEDTNIFEWIDQVAVDKTPVAVIIDESHYGKRDSDSAIQNFMSDLCLRLGYGIFLIEASATPILTESNKQRVKQISTREVIEAGLLRKTVRLNEGVMQAFSSAGASDYDTNMEQVLFDVAFNKLEQIDAEYEKLGSRYRGLMAVQLPSGIPGAHAIERIKTWCQQHDVTLDNQRLAIFLSKEKTSNMANIHRPSSPVRVLLYKQGIATGWDCPRSQVLLGLRNVQADIFQVQNLGRFIRTTEARHYDSDLLDSAYIYTNILGNDLGVSGFGGDSTGMELVYESEVIRRRDESGRLALSSLDELRLQPGMFLRQKGNSDAPDYQLMRQKWMGAAKTENLGAQLAWVRVRGAEEEFIEAVGQTEGVIEGRDGSMEITKSWQVQHGVCKRWDDLERKIFDAVCDVRQESSGSSVSLSRFFRFMATAWLAEAMLMPSSRIPERSHWGSATEILLQEKANHGEHNPIDIHVFATEILAHGDNFKILRKVIQSVLQAKDVEPLAAGAHDGPVDTPAHARQLVSREVPYVLPGSLTIKRTDDRRVDPRRDHRYAYAEQALPGAARALSAYRQEKTLSGPEERFEAELMSMSGFGISLAFFMKNGTYREKNLSLPVRNSDREANFFPDYLVEYLFREGKTRIWKPAIFEVKEGPLTHEHYDLLAQEKAQALIRLSREYRIPAGLVFPGRSRGFHIMTGPGVDDYEEFTMRYLKKFF